jgi:hypothetical protein
MDLMDLIDKTDSLRFMKVKHYDSQISGNVVKVETVMILLESEVKE